MINIQASKPPPLPASRTLTNNSDSSFVQSILNDELNSGCIALRTLSKVTNVPVDEISEMIKGVSNKVFQVIRNESKVATRVNLLTNITFTSLATRSTELLQP